jgi:hypothetical protein
LPLTKQQHLDPSLAPKRILSLDGGGIRGVLTLEYLAAIEDMLRKRRGDEKLVLSDYFDLIGGTSTGSIIAAGLACGLSVEQLKQIYTSLGASAFQAGAFSGLRLPGVLTPKFPAGPLKQALDDQLGGDTTLGGEKVRTGLMVMTKRLDTGSPWPLNNGGRGNYAVQDGALVLSDVVRASTAAPTYFEPERIAIHSRSGSVVDGEFVDGGVSPHNDPALQLLMLAALEGYGFRWRTGKNQLLIISVGTGSYRSSSPTSGLIGGTAAAEGVGALQSLLDDCARSNQTLLQWLTDCLTPWLIDRAVGDMKLDSAAGPQLATYVRYNALLEMDWLKNVLGLDFTADQVAQIQKIDDPSNMKELSELGHKAAAEQVKAEHLPAAFDLEPS